MKLKKIPYYLLLLLLTSGASLILGLLSFSGMFALWPIIPLALGAFALSVAYEGEIYLQNIKGALSKLFKPNYLKRQLAEDYLLSNFPDTTAKNCPQFFKDYENQLFLLHQFDDFEHPVAKDKRRLNKEGRARKKQIEKTLRDMEKWFAKVLLNDKDKRTPYEQELFDWLEDNDLEIWQQKYDDQQTIFRLAQLGSAFAGICMIFGTTFLLLEAFTIIPLLAALPLTLLPAVILPMAVIAGTAYGLLTYNAVTDMITNDTMSRWYRNLRDSLSKGITVQNTLLTIAAVALLALTFALTLCTAGTWWTVVKQTPPLFNWFKKIPTLIAQGVVACTIGVATFIFNIENAFETLDLIKDIDLPDFFNKTIQSIKNGFAWLKANETAWQMANPFRILLKLTITPLRILLFFGHLLSIGVTSDRVPGIPEIVSALLGIISEGFEDAHYFVNGGDGHAHTHSHATEDLLKERLGADAGHSHELDIPTKILKAIFYPLYCAAALWDHLTCKLDQQGNPTLSYAQALDKQMGVAPEEAFELPDDAVSPSLDWQAQHIIHLIEKQKEKLAGTGIAAAKRDELDLLEDEIYNKTLDLSDTDAVDARLTLEKNKPIYNTHRYTPTFLASGQTTNTYQFLENLRERTKSPTSVMDIDNFDEDGALPASSNDDTGGGFIPIKPPSTTPAKNRNCGPDCADQDCKPTKPFSFLDAIAKYNSKAGNLPAASNLSPSPANNV